MEKDMEARVIAGHMDVGGLGFGAWGLRVLGTGVWSLGLRVWG